MNKLFGLLSGFVLIAMPALQASAQWGVTYNFETNTTAQEDTCSIDRDSTNHYVLAYKTTNGLSLKIRYWNGTSYQTYTATAADLGFTPTTAGRTIGCVSMAVDRDAAGGDVVTVGYVVKHFSDEQVNFKYFKWVRGATVAFEQDRILSLQSSWDPGVVTSNAHEWFDSDFCSALDYTPQPYPYHYYGNITANPANFETDNHSYTRSNGRIKVACASNRFWFACSVSSILNWANSNPEDFNFEEHSALYVLPETGYEPAGTYKYRNLACEVENGAAGGGSLHRMNFTADPNGTLFPNAWFLAYGDMGTTPSGGSGTPTVVAGPGVTGPNPLALPTVPEIAVKCNGYASYTLYAAYADSDITSPGTTFFRQCLSGSWGGQTPTNCALKPLCVGISNDGAGFFIAVGQATGDSETQLFRTSDSTLTLISTIGREYYGDRLVVYSTSNKCAIAMRQGIANLFGKITYYNRILSEP